MMKHVEVGDKLYTHRSDDKLRLHRVTQVIDNMGSIIVIADDGRFSASVRMIDITWFVAAWYEIKHD